MQALKELTDKQAEQRALGYRYTADFSRVGYMREQVDTLERKTIPGLARALIRELAMRESVGDARIRLASQDLRQIPPPGDPGRAVAARGGGRGKPVHH